MPGSQQTSPRRVSIHPAGGENCVLYFHNEGFLASWDILVSQMSCFYLASSGWTTNCVLVLVEGGFPGIYNLYLTLVDRCWTPDGNSVILSTVWRTSQVSPQTITLPLHYWNNFPGKVWVTEKRWIVKTPNVIVYKRRMRKSNNMISNTVCKIWETR